MVSWNLDFKQRYYAILLRKNIIHLENIIWFSNNIIHCMILLIIYIYICSYPQSSFQKYVASLWEVAFKTHSSPSDRVWLSMVWFTVSCCTKGNPFIYTTIPLKEGDVPVIKRNAWNCHLKKYSVPCRKYSIILKGYSSISSCSFRDHSAACLYASFLEKDAIYYICSFLWKEGGIPCSEENYTNRATTSRKSEIRPCCSGNMENTFSR